jgi:uncharacterized protein (DUF3084 family)
MSLKKSDYAFRADKGLRTIIKRQKAEIAQKAEQIQEKNEYIAKLEIVGGQACGEIERLKGFIQEQAQNYGFTHLLEEKYNE